MALSGDRLFPRGTLGLLATLVAIAFTAAGCGGDSDEKLSVADAKAKLSKDCQEGDASDKKLCDCIADELAKAGRSAKQIDDIRKEVNEGSENKLVTRAGRACNTRLGKEAGGG